jgi:hypothetical protein
MLIFTEADVSQVNRTLLAVIWDKARRIAHATFVDEMKSCVKNFPQSTNGGICDKLFWMSLRNVPVPACAMGFPGSRQREIDSHLLSHKCDPLSRWVVVVARKFWSYAAGMIYSGLPNSRSQ